MTDRNDLIERVSGANSVRDPDEIAESLNLGSTLLEIIDTRAEDGVDAMPTRGLDRRKFRGRPLIAFGSAMVVLLLALGLTTFLLGGNGAPQPPAGEVNTTPPSSQQPSTTAAAPSEPQEAVVVAPEPRLEWNTIDPEGSVDGEGGVAGFGVGDGRVVVSGSHWSDGDGVWYSDDLVVWTSASVEPTPTDEFTDPVGINSLAYGPEGWVAAGNNLGGTNGTFWYSEDATEWILGKLNSPPESSSGWFVNDIAAGGPGWVAVGGLQRDGRIWVSTDGLNWDTIALPEFAEVWFHDVSVDDGALTVIGRPQDRQRDTAATPGDDVIALRWVSEDGLSWTPLPFQDGPVGPESHTISVNPDTGEQVALNKYGVWASEDGLEWEQVASSNGIPPYTHPSQEVVWVGDTMVGASRDFIFESSDGGATWVRTGPTDLEFGHPRRLFSFGDGVIALAWADVWVGALE